MNLEQLGEVLETDVLIVGGGLAGNNAAIAAAEKGANVIVADKAALARCGAIAGGVDHFIAYLDTNDEWDSRKAYLNMVANAGRGAVNISVQNAVYCNELSAALERMERINSLKQEDGAYYRTKSFGMPGPYWINFNGKLLKPRLAREAKRLGVRALEKVAINNLLTDGQKVVGAVGFHIRTGQFFIIKAKATILATGNTNRLFANLSGLPFNTWQCPVNTGASQTMAFAVGAKLANMEICRITIVPKGFSAAGLNALTGMGGKIINAYGEDFMLRHDPRGTKAPRSTLVKGVINEIKEGRGPIFVDCTHLSENDINHLYKTLGYDKDTLPDFIKQKGIDLRKDPVEIMPSEGMQGGATEFCSSGVMIDEQCRSTIDGLFGAGDAADQMRCVHICITGGYLAGKIAADYAKDYSAKFNVSNNQVRELKEKIFAPMRREGSFSYNKVEEALRRVMWENVGVNRSEKTLQTALEKVNKLETIYKDVVASNYHELTRTLETNQLLQVAKMMCTASLARKESRFGAYFNRIDYPDTDPSFDGQIEVFKTEKGIGTSFKKLDYNVDAVL